MNWKFKNNRTQLIEEKGNIICNFTEDADNHHKSIIKYAPELYDAILEFSQSVETSKSPRNPKKHYENFQRLLDLIVESSNE